MNRLLLIATLITLLSGCTWVQLTSEGQGVRLASTSEVTSCTRIGRAYAQTLSGVSVVERGGQRLQDELLTLGRNEAGRMGGNTIVPETVIDEGQQSFGVYSCP